MLLNRSGKRRQERATYGESAEENCRRRRLFNIQLKMGATNVVATSAMLVVICLLSTPAPSLAIYSNGECTFNTKGSCEYHGQVFGIGDSWITNDCFHCVCMEPFGVGCCDHNPQPVDYPDWCEVIRKPDSCASVVVMKANHKFPCLYRKEGKHADWKSDNEPVF